jgi:hypothetical protein
MDFQWPRIIGFPMKETGKNVTLLTLGFKTIYLPNLLRNFDRSPRVLKLVSYFFAQISI